VCAHLARRELLQFASAVQTRICRGQPNRESKDAPGFADKVDKHIQTFQPYLQRTGRSYMCILYIVLATVTQMQVCTERQVQAMQLDVCMQELQLKASNIMQQHLPGHAVKAT